MSLIELATPDLSWMRKVHRPDEVMYQPMQMPEKFASVDGKSWAIEPHAVCARGDVCCLHRGKLPGLAPTPSDAVLDWLMWTFFVTHGLKPVELLTMDGFKRWVEDAPRPEVKLCTTCGGTGADPNLREEDGLIGACPTCKGEQRYVNEAAAAVEIGPVKVLAGTLRPFLPHLCGANVGIGVAPAANQPGQLDLHIRHVIDEAQSTGGDWRIHMVTL